MTVVPTVPIVERVFTVDGADVPCRFFPPVPDRGDFRCRFEIAWPDGVRGREAWGVDEVQALILAMQSAHCDLLLRRTQDGVEVAWLGQCRLGLPIADSIRDLDKDEEPASAKPL